ncbi:MAG: DUF368 domain-containing protein [Clostridium sp.]|nr:DUF368 domain-containing protein [Clostridium sp.]
MVLIKIMFRIFQGALIGLGAVLPGISGGVLSVMFGVYKPVMEFLSDPVHRFKTHMPRLFPYFIGYILGFMGVANILAFFLEKYPAPSICLFVGLIMGMLPSLWREAGLSGRNSASIISMLTAILIIFSLLFCLKKTSAVIQPNFIWFLFCGFCLALSIIAPGMSFSTLLMPLGLYTPFVDGIGHLTPAVLIPAGIGGVITIAALSKTVNSLFDRHYSVAFHAIVGTVVSATFMTIPFESFKISAASCLINVFFMAAGVFIASVMDRVNEKLKA